MSARIDVTIAAVPGSELLIDNPSNKSRQPNFDTQLVGQKQDQEFNDLFSQLPDGIFSDIDFADENKDEAADLWNSFACKPAHLTNPSYAYGPPVSTMALNPGMAGADIFSNTMDYLGKWVNQVVKGNYTEDVTLLCTIAQIATGVIDLDLPADIRDLT